MENEVNTRRLIDYRHGGVYNYILNMEYYAWR